MGAGLDIIDRSGIYLQQSDLMCDHPTASVPIATLIEDGPIMTYKDFGKWTVLGSNQ